MSDEEEEDSKVDQLIEAIFDALPATSYEEITRKVVKATKLKTNIGQINNAICHLRANCAEYGWTIPHVKRGNAIDSDKGRYIALLVDRQGHYELDQNPDATRHISNGITGTIKQTMSLMQNVGTASRIAATHTRSVNQRARLNDLASDFEYIARKAAAVARDIEIAKLA
jgi:hypothetical protein